MARKIVARKRARKGSKGGDRKLHVVLNLTLDRLEEKFDLARQKGHPRLVMSEDNHILFHLDTALDFAEQIDCLGPKYKFL